MYRWKRNKMFNTINAQADLMIVVKAMRYYTKDGERMNLCYEIPVIENDSFNIERFESDDEYLVYLEHGNREGYSV